MPSTHGDYYLAVINEVSLKKAAISGGAADTGNEGTLVALGSDGKVASTLLPSPSGAITGTVLTATQGTQATSTVTGSIIAGGGVGVAGNVWAGGRVVAGAGVVFPSADPLIAGAWWDNAGTLTKSAG